MLQILLLTALAFSAADQDPIPAAFLVPGIAHGDPGGPGHGHNPAHTPAGGPLLRVASIQMNAFSDYERDAKQETADRCSKMVEYVQRASALGARIVVFPEMSLTRYDAELIRNGSQADIDDAEASLRAAARQHGVWYRA